jgi:hypothetical protein
MYLLHYIISMAMRDNITLLLDFLYPVLLPYGSNDGHNFEGNY